MITVDQGFTEKLASCPGKLRSSVRRVIKLVEQTASSCGINSLEETLKWGELAFSCRGGSTIRIGWSDDKPDRYALYFNCNSKLVETFRTVYSDLFEFEGNRALVFSAGDTLPEPALGHCVELALRYHRLKHLPLLGA